MKKIKKSFADRARELQNRYTRSKFDKTEADELEAAMEKLMAEQEMMRSVLGLNEQPQQMQQFGGGGSPEDPETVQRNNEPTYPSWIPSWGKSALEGLNYVNTLGNSLGNNGDLITGIAPVPGRGFKSGVDVAKIGSGRFLDDALDFAKNPWGTKFVPEKVGPGMNVMKSPVYKPTTPISTRGGKDLGLVKNPATSLGRKQINPATSYESIGDATVTPTRDALRAMAGKQSYSTTNPLATEKELLSTFGGKTPTIKIGKTGSKLQGATPSASEQMYGNLQNIGGKWYTVDPSTGVKIPWKGIGYGAAGIGGAGLLGASIYGLTQLPDGRVVDKEGNVVSQAQIDAISSANPSISKQAGFNPTDEWLNSIGWNTKLPTIEQTKDKVKSGNTTGGTSKVKTTEVTPQSTQAQVLDPSGWNNVVDNIALSGPVAQQPNYYNQLYENVKGYNQNKRKDTVLGNLSKELSPANNEGGKESFLDKNKQFLPQAVGGLSNIAGNLLLAAMSKKSPQISPAIATPEKINLEPKAEQLRRDASVSKNVNMVNARNLGLNPGATLGNLGVINASVDRGLGANLTDLYMGQEQANVGAANQFALQNQDAINRVNMINSQMKFQKDDDRMNYIAQALSVPANIAREITMAKSDSEMKAILDRYYQSMGKNYQTQGSIYGENAFTTKVK